MLDGEGREGRFKGRVWFERLVRNWWGNLLYSSLVRIVGDGVTELGEKLG